MLRFLGWRLAQLVPTLLGITLVTFAIAHLVPGDAPGTAEGQLGASREAAIEFRHAMGLDLPLPEQYAQWLTRLGHLDLGRSSRDGRPVAEKIREAAPTTAGLALAALLLIVVVSVPAGIQAATHPSSLLEKVLRGGMLLLHSLPNFWVAVVLLDLVGSGAGWTWVLPVLCLSLGGLATVARQVRGSLREVLAANYIRTARSAGIPERTILLRHALPNAALPMLNTLGSLVPHLLGGSVVVETVFGIPGMGLLGFQAVATRDYATLMGLAVVGALATVGANLLVDVLSMWIDPRLAHVPAQ